jgi:hypothetical protein
MRLLALRALHVAVNSFVGGCATRCVARLTLSISLISAFNPGLRRLRTLLPGATHQERR